MKKVMLISILLALAVLLCACRTEYRLHVKDANIVSIDIVYFPEFICLPRDVQVVLEAEVLGTVNQDQYDEVFDGLNSIYHDPFMCYIEEVVVGTALRIEYDNGTYELIFCNMTYYTTVETGERLRYYPNRFIRQEFEDLLHSFLPAAST